MFSAALVPIQRTTVAGINNVSAVSVVRELTSTRGTDWPDRVYYKANEPGHQPHSAKPEIYARAENQRGRGCVLAARRSYDRPTPFLDAAHEPQPRHFCAAGASSSIIYVRAGQSRCQHFVFRLATLRPQGSQQSLHVGGSGGRNTSRWFDFCQACLLRRDAS